MAWRAIRYNVPKVTDYKFWEERKVARGGQVYGFQDGRAIGIPDVAEWGFEHWYKPGMTTEEYLEKTGTVAFVVLRGDTILYENYLGGFADTSRFNPFSMTKSYLGTLAGIAISEGLIDSIDQSIGDFLPWCQDSALCKITIRHLLQMTSGLQSNEAMLNPWGSNAMLYYGNETDKIVHDLHPKRPPGTRFVYQNINSQLMGYILQKATGKPLAQYLSEKLWVPLGMEADAGWSLHEDLDVEKSFCCLNARARDFARFGLLMLNGGHWHGKQLVPEQWIKDIMSLDTTGGALQRYHYNWYLTAEREDFWAEGLLGQFTYICPKSRTVIVRIGNTLDYNVPWYDSFKILAGLRHKPHPMPFKKRDLQPYAGTYTFGLSNFGDTSLVGKTANLTATAKGLKVKTDFNKTWIARPENDSVFYYVSVGRQLTFHRDNQGNIIGMRWYRRGNEWELEMKNEK